MSERGCVGVLPDDLALLSPGPALDLLLDGVERSSLDDGDLVRVAQARQRLVSHVQAQLLADLHAIGRRCDEAVGVVDPVAAGRWAEVEVAFAMRWTGRAAAGQLGLADDLVNRLPAVFAALDAGEIDVPKARVFAEVTCGLELAVAREVAGRVLDDAGRWTTGQLRARLQRLVLAVDPEAAASRAVRAVAGRRVQARLTDEGVGELCGYDLPPHRVAAAMERLTAIARAAKNDGDLRKIDQLRADVFLDLLVGDGIAVGGPVTEGGLDPGVGMDSADFNVGAGVDPEGSLDTDAGLNPDSKLGPDASLDPDGKLGPDGECRPDGECGPGGEFDSDSRLDPESEYGPGGELRPVRELTFPDRELRPDRERELDGGCDPGGSRPDDVFGGGGRPGMSPWPGGEDPRPAPESGASRSSGHNRPPSGHSAVDDDFGEPRGALPGPRKGVIDLQIPLLTLMGLADLPGELGGWGPVIADIARQVATQQPDATWRYSIYDQLGELALHGITRRRPTAETTAFIKARDRTCRAPGCRMPAKLCDTDHTIDWATSNDSRPENLATLCARHHHFKHLDASDLTQITPGVLGWTTPLGQCYVTTPPTYPDDPPIPHR